MSIIEKALEGTVEEAKDMNPGQININKEAALAQIKKRNQAVKRLCKRQESRLALTFQAL